MDCNLECPNGSKSWLLDYVQPLTKKRTSLSFGIYPDITIASARELRKHAKELLAKGVDPKDHKIEQELKQQELITNTLFTLAGSWLKIKKSKVSADYAEDIWRSLELHVFPDLGECPISTITAPLAIKAIQPLAAWCSAGSSLGSFLTKWILVAAPSFVVEY